MCLALWLGICFILFMPIIYFNGHFNKATERSLVKFMFELNRIMWEIFE